MPVGFGVAAGDWPDWSPLRHPAGTRLRVPPADFCRKIAASRKKKGLRRLFFFRRAGIFRLIAGRGPEGAGGSAGSRSAHPGTALVTRLAGRGA